MITEGKTEHAVRFHPRRLGHANLFVSDLDRSMRFYHAVCGLEEVRREPAIRIGFLSNGNTHHHDVGLVQSSTAGRVGRGGFVMSRGDRRATGLNHLGFEMENEAELVEAYRRATACGVEIDRTVDHLISRSVYLPDPAGNVLEFYADVTKDWRSIFCPEREDLVSLGTSKALSRPPTRASCSRRAPRSRPQRPKSSLREGEALLRSGARRGRQTPDWAALGAT